MSEDSARFWSVIFGGVTTIGLVLGGTYTVIQYFDSRKKDAQTYALQAATAQLEAR